MQKKITSSLIIAAYCLNSLPVFAGPLAPFSSGVASGNAEKAGVAISPSARFNSNPWVEREENIREISRMLEQSQELADKNGWGAPGEQGRSNRVSRWLDKSVCITLSTDFAPELMSKTIVNHFGKKGLNSHGVVVESQRNSAEKKVFSCFYIGDIKKLATTMERSVEYVNVSNWLQKLDFGEKIELKSLDQNAVYSYARFFPDFSESLGNKHPFVKNDDYDPAGIYAPYGEIELSFSVFSDKARALKTSADPILFSSLDKQDADKKWKFFLFPGGENYIALGNIPYHNGDSFLNIDTLRKFFLMDYANASGTSVKSFFGGGLFASPTTHSSVPDISTINPLTDLEQSSSPSLDESRKYSNEVAPTQASHAASNSHLFYYIGTGALAAVFSVFGGAAAYHWWKSKMPMRNKAYDAAMYNKNPDGSQVIVPAVQL